MNLAERFAALNNKTKRADNFIVEYLGLPDNISNVLGRQTKSISRPNITFQPHNTHFRGARFSDKGQVEFEPVRVAMWDDEGAVTSNIINAQLFRQINKYEDVNGLFPDQDHRERQYKFDIRVKMMDSQDQVVEEFILKDCFINSVEYSQLEITDDTESIIDLTVSYDNLAIGMFGEYIEYRESRKKTTP